jgi:hypothetical protein
MARICEGRKRIPEYSEASVKFDMNDAHAAPIKWKSRNGKAMTAIRVPRAGTRKSFRKLAQQTGWINNVVERLKRTPAIRRRLSGRRRDTYDTQFNLCLELGEIRFRR